MIFAVKSLATVFSDHKGVLVADIVQQRTRVNVVSFSVTLLLITAARQHSAAQFQRDSTSPAALPVGNLGTSGVKRCPSTECLTSVLC